MKKSKRWPKLFSVPYLAERAGVSRFVMLRRLKRIAETRPELRKALDARQLTLRDLRALDSGLFDSIRLGEMLEDDDEAA